MCESLKYFSLGDLCEIGSGPRAIPKSRKDDFVCAVESIGVRNGRILEDKILYLDANGFRRSSGVKYGDLVYVTVGPHAGEIAINLTDKELFVVGSLCSIISRDKSLDSWYLFAYLQSQRSFIIKNMKRGTSKRAEISIVKLSRLKVPVPPMEVQLQIVKKFKDIWELMWLGRKLKEKLECLSEYSLKLQGHCYHKTLGLFDFLKHK